MLRSWFARAPFGRARSRAFSARITMSPRVKLLLVLLVAAVAIPTLAAEDKPANKQEFMRDFAGPDSHKAGAAVAKLNPDLKSDYDLLKFTLERGTWYLRGQAINVLAKTGNDKNQKDMLECLTEKGSKDPLVRQGMAAAIAKMNDRAL